MPAPPPPTPRHLIRSHTAQVNVVSFSDDNERISSGDASGTVVVTSTRSLRPIAIWKAHADGLLGIEEWEDNIITHGRDNKLHVWSSIPELCYSLDVNALNYCRFSLLSLPGDARMEGRHALMAVPNLVESSFADIWTLPGKDRLHAATGKAGQVQSASDGREVRNPIGIIMSMHLSMVPHPHAAGRTRLRLLCGYENGSVTMREYTRDDKEKSVEGLGWEILWSTRLHVESVMAIAVSRDGSFALSVSADHLIGRYNFAEAEQQQDSSSPAYVAHRSKHPGNASVCIADDGRVCAVGGWDGKIRLYSTKTFKPLGDLDYHKKNCQSVAFARAQLKVPAQPATVGGVESDFDEDMMSEVEKQERGRWLASGAQDNRVAIWSLMDFGKT